MKDDLICLSLKWNTTPLILWIEDKHNLIQMEDNLNIFTNGRQPQKEIMQPKTIKIETMVVALSRVT